MPLYSPATKLIKAEKGRVLTGERISLLDTGDFWNSFWVKAQSGKLMFDASDRKTETLIKEYGNLIFGLSDTQREYLAELARPILYEKITNFLKSA